MNSFEFKDKLEIDPFPTDNDYLYQNLREGKLRFYTDSENLPYIVKGFTQEHAKLGRIVSSEYYNQFRSRQLTTKKIKEVMNTSRYPIHICLKDNHYYIGKGFIARSPYLGHGNYDLLFVACIDGRKKTPPVMHDIKLFVSRKVYLEENKPILPAVRDYMNNHVGDVILTHNIYNYIGDSIKIPTGGTLVKQKEYKDAVVLECLEDVLKVCK